MTLLLNKLFLIYKINVKVLILYLAFWYNISNYTFHNKLHCLIQKSWSSWYGLMVYVYWRSAIFRLSDTTGMTLVQIRCVYRICRSASLSSCEGTGPMQVSFLTWQNAYLLKKIVTTYRHFNFGTVQHLRQQLSMYKLSYKFECNII